MVKKNHGLHAALKSKLKGGEQMELPTSNHSSGFPLVLQVAAGEVENKHNKEMMVQNQPDEGKGYFLTVSAKGYNGVSENPLPCFGCGIGWFSFIMGFVFPPLWYYATILYFRNYHLKEPRERAGLAASAIAALISSVALVITLLSVFLQHLF